MLIRFIILIIISIFPYSVASSQTLSISDNDYSAGYVTLNWFSAKGNIFELEEYVDKKWIAIYKGKDKARSISGLSDGTYTYRLIADGKQAGETISFTVQHYSLKRAWMFFTTGAVMLSILIFIIFSRSSQPAELKNAIE